MLRLLALLALAAASAAPALADEPTYSLVIVEHTGYMSNVRELIAVPDLSPSACPKMLQTLKAKGFLVNTEHPPMGKKSFVCVLSGAPLITDPADAYLHPGQY